MKGLTATLRAFDSNSMQTKISKNKFTYIFCQLGESCFPQAATSLTFFSNILIHIASCSVGNEFTRKSLKRQFLDFAESAQTYDKMMGEKKNNPLPVLFQLLQSET